MLRRPKPREIKNEDPPLNLGNCTHEPAAIDRPNRKAALSPSNGQCRIFGIPLETTNGARRVAADAPTLETKCTDLIEVSAGRQSTLYLRGICDPFVTLPH